MGLTQTSIVPVNTCPAFHLLSPQVWNSFLGVWKPAEGVLGVQEAGHSARLKAERKRSLGGAKARFVCLQLGSTEPIQMK